MLQAGPLIDRLGKAFTEEQPFPDVDNIEPSLERCSRCRVKPITPVPKPWLQPPTE